MSEIYKKVEKYIGEGEVFVEGNLHHKSQFKPNYEAIIPMITFIFFFIVMASTFMNSYGALFLALGILFVITIFSKKNHSKTTSDYVITSKKVIILNGKHKPSFYPYDKIYNIELTKIKIGNNSERGCIYLHLASNNKIRLIPYRTAENVYDALYSNWIRNAPNIKFKRVINIFLKKYKILSIPLYPKREDNIKISETFDQITLTANIINNITPKKALAYSNCSNEENNYFYISHEKTNDAWQKMIGKQDYIIGDSWMDEKFIIQGNNESFIKYILDDDCISKIRETENEIKYTFSLGKKEKMKDKAHYFEEGQMLDEHLTKNTRSKENTSMLSLEIKDLGPELDYEVLGKKVVEKLELMIYLAKKINGYNNK